MNYEDRIVCFLDILGFKNHISTSINADGTDNSTQLDKLIDVFNIIRNVLDLDSPNDRFGNEVTQFSDCVVISFPATTESGVFYALLDILLVQVSLVFEGVLCRGGIARGKVIHNPKLLFGPAMIEAYYLESEAALYPRVILDKSIVEAGIKAHAHHHLPKHEAQSIMRLLEKDSDGMYYINYITGAQSELNDPELDYPNYLYQLRQIISSGIGAKNPSVAIKYSWLREKLALHLIRVKEAARQAPEGDELRNAYEGIPDC